jgi:GT2 family glycosyltransferase
MLISYLLYFNKKKSDNHLFNSIKSILEQSIPYWELYILSENIGQRDLTQIIKKRFSGNKTFGESKKKIKIISFESEKLQNVFNIALKRTKGDLISLISSGDSISHLTTYELIKCRIHNPDLELIYSDHDYIDELGIRSSPIRKPLFSLDYIFTRNYMDGITAFDKNKLRGIKNQSNLSIEQLNYMNVLNIIGAIYNSKTSKLENKIARGKIIHIPLFLQHKLISGACNTQTQRAINIKDPIYRVLLDNLKRCDSKVKLKKAGPLSYRAIWPIPYPLPIVTLIIPTKNKAEILKICVESILKKTRYKNYEIIIIDNGSTEIETLRYLQEVSRNHCNIRILKYPYKFNYSSMNNYAVKHAKGSILGFINNDVEVINADWLTELVRHACRPLTGAVGCLLLYPDKTIQHAGVSLFKNGHVHHEFSGIRFNRKNQNYEPLISTRNPIAVTAAVMVIEKAKFTTAGGFDNKNLKIAFNDVALCVKLYKLGFNNLWTPYAKLFHHESKSRGRENSQKEILYIINFVKRSFRKVFKQCYIKI